MSSTHCASTHGIVERTATQTLTPGDWEKLLKRQQVMEENSVALGGVRFRRRMEQAQQGGQGSTVGATRKLLSAAIDGVEKRIKEDVEPVLGAWDEEQGKRVGGKRGRRHTLVSWAAACEKSFGTELDYAGVAYITVKTVLDHIHHRPSLFYLTTELVNRLVDEMRYRKFQLEAPGLFTYKMNNFTTDNYAHMARSLSASMKFAEIDAEEFNLPTQQQMRMGSRLLDIVMETTGLVALEKDTQYQWSSGQVHRRDEFKVEATPETQEWLARRNDKLEFMQPVFMPMVVPPLAWESGQRGGYRFALRTGSRAKFIRGLYQGHSDTDAPMPAVYEAINRMQETAFAINLPVLQLMEQIERRGGGRAGIPSMEPLEEPVKTFDETLSKQELKDSPEFSAWKKAMAKMHGMEAERAARAREFLRVLGAAQEVTDERAIWFPWNVDFRGRAYPICDALSPQGDDFQKALLRFATGKPLGQDGSFYLAVHGANCLDEIPEGFEAVDGIRKFGSLSVQERNDWIEAHTKEIVAVAEAPLENRWWMDAEDPFMFYAFCLEWAGYWEAYQRGEGEQFISYLPCAADGTCNGLQHFAALFLDPHGKHVNLTPSERPEDVYTMVAEAVQARLEAAEGEEDGEMASLWLTSGLLGRSLFKRPTMTFGYGSKQYGFSHQLVEYLRDKTDYRETKEHFRLEDKDVVRAACIYLASHIWKALDNVVVKAKEGMDWFQACAREIAKTGEPVEWTVPLTGFPVVQTYYEAHKKQIDTILLGKLCQPVFYEGTINPDVRKQANGVSPNLIHSLDAAALMLTVTNCSREQEGMSFLMVHDSYATHAGDAGLLNKTLRESFVQLYSNVDVLEDLRKQFQRQTKVELPAPPAKGSLDLADVLSSDHFFC